MDVKGNTIIIPQFKEADDFYEGRARVKLAGTYGFGFIDEAGQVVIPYRFHHAFNFQNGVAHVQVGNRQGFIDRGGQIVVPLTFAADTNCLAAHASEGLIAANLGGLWGYIDLNGQTKIPPKFDRGAEDFSDGLALVHSSENSKSGYIDHTGRFVISSTNDYGDFSEGLARVWQSIGLCLTISSPCKTGHGFIDKSGKLVIPAEEGRSCSKFVDGLADCLRPSEGYGFINRQGQWVIAPHFSGVKGFSEGLAAATIKESGKYLTGFIGQDGQWVIHPIFTKASSFSNGLAYVEVDQRWGYIDLKGHYIRGPSEF